MDAASPVWRLNLGSDHRVLWFAPICNSFSRIWKLPQISPSPLLVTVPTELEEPHEAIVHHLVQK